MTRIGEIITHPRYREFARACTEHGKQVEPDTFPWSLMGKTDVELWAADLRYDNGELITQERKTSLLETVRAQERLVETYWQWWRSWEWLAKKESPAKAEPVSATAKPGLLFEI